VGGGKAKQNFSPNLCLQQVTYFTGSRTFLDELKRPLQKYNFPYITRKTNAGVERVRRCLAAAFTCV
jgi:hypothetical protein